MKKLFSKKSTGQPVNVMSFLTHHYQRHNIARLQHLESLQLPITNKTVLEVGAGVGDHTYYLAIKNCKVTITEGRQELVDFLKSRFDVKALKLDVEKDLALLNNLPDFDIVYCYGLLYHINNPEEFLTAVSKKSNMLLLETCISPDNTNYGPNLVAENAAVYTQAISGTGCRPNRKWLFDTLKKLYPYVYVTKTQPNHEEFPTDWNNIEFDFSKLVRGVYVASKTPINSEHLADTLLAKQTTF